MFSFYELKSECSLSGERFCKLAHSGRSAESMAEFHFLGHRSHDDWHRGRKRCPRQLDADLTRLSQSPHCRSHHGGDNLDHVRVQPKNGVPLLE